MSDPQLILLLSGSIAVGKTTLAQELTSSYGFKIVKTGTFLSSLAQRSGVLVDRRSLQDLGDRLDLETNYRWVVDAAAGAIGSDTGLWLLDSVRKSEQVKHFRDRFGKAILHAHLYGDEALLRSRYESRFAAGKDYLGNTSYEQAVRHPNEVATRALRSMSDLNFDVSATTSSTIAQQIMMGIA